MNIKYIKCIFTVMLSVFMVCGCNSGNVEESGTEKADNKGHEPLKILSTTDIDELKELVHKKYPEINLELYPYAGKNFSRFTCDQMITGDMPDIYNTTLAWTNYPDEMQENLIDLSSYSFTDNYDPTLLGQQEINGGIYLLPSKYSVYSCAYNKTLFEKYGWEVPESFEELKELAPEIEKEGVRLSVTNTSAAGLGFQYICNLADTIDLSSVKGVQWQRDFLTGKATAEQGFGEALEYMQEWIDLGYLQGKDALDGKSSFEIFTEGNTAFAIGGVDRWTQNEDGTGDVYAPMPYLSKDGSNNMYITMQSKNFGLSKKLTEKGNEQKLEDALHVMEVISTTEGQNTFFNEMTTYISSLREWEIDPESPYVSCMDEMRNGHSAPLLYTGWESILPRIGEEGLAYINGECTKEDLLDEINNLCNDWLTNGLYVYSEVDREYNQNETARLTGKIFGDAVGADCALISMNPLENDTNIQNPYGVNGYIMPLPLTDERIVSVIPTGWSDTIQTVTLTGSQIKEYAEKGYKLETDSGAAVFPYELVVKGGKELDDNTEYKVAVCGADDEMCTSGNIQDSGVEGLKAFRDFFDNNGKPPMSEELLNWDE